MASAAAVLRWSHKQVAAWLALVRGAVYAPYARTLEQAKVDGARLARLTSQELECIFHVRSLGHRETLLLEIAELLAPYAALSRQTTVSLMEVLVEQLRQHGDLCTRQGKETLVDTVCELSTILRHAISLADAEVHRAAVCEGRPAADYHDQRAVAVSGLAHVHRLARRAIETAQLPEDLLIACDALVRVTQRILLSTGRDGAGVSADAGADAAADAMAARTALSPMLQRMRADAAAPLGSAEALWNEVLVRVGRAKSGTGEQLPATQDAATVAAPSPAAVPCEQHELPEAAAGEGSSGAAAANKLELLLHKGPDGTFGIALGERYCPNSPTPVTAVTYIVPGGAVDRGQQQLGVDDVLMVVADRRASGFLPQSIALWLKQSSGDVKLTVQRWQPAARACAKCGCDLGAGVVLTTLPQLRAADPDELHATPASSVAPQPIAPAPAPAPPSSGGDDDDRLDRPSAAEAGSPDQSAEAASAAPEATAAADEPRAPQRPHRASMVDRLGSAIGRLLPLQLRPSRVSHPPQGSDDTGEAADGDEQQLEGQAQRFTDSMLRDARGGTLPGRVRGAPADDVKRANVGEMPCRMVTGVGCERHGNLLMAPIGASPRGLRQWLSLRPRLKRVWAVLNGSVLFFFETTLDERPTTVWCLEQTDTIDEMSMEAVSDLLDRKRSTLCFPMRLSHGAAATGGLILVAETSYERSMWMSVLRATIENPTGNAASAVAAVAASASASDATNGQGP